MEEITQDTQDSYLSVSQFVKITDSSLRKLGFARILGEISEYKLYSHAYFKLKDEQSVIDCILFANKLQSLDFVPKDGQKVIITGYSSIYSKNGQFKVVVTAIKPEGMGEILQRLLLLKDKLEKEGVFSLLNRSLPDCINTIGVITSKEGRVIHDITQTLYTRNRGIKVIIYPAQVQGENAPQSLINALNLANEQNICDVLIIGRGGGSFEDLLAFSDERLVRNIAKSKIPIISAVGHEPDFALSDFAADIKAATPTQAAMLITPITTEQMHGFIDKSVDLLNRSIENIINNLLLCFDNQLSKLESLSPQRYIERLLNQLNTNVNNLNYLFSDKTKAAINSFNKNISILYNINFYDKISYQGELLNILLGNINKQIDLKLTKGYDLLRAKLLTLNSISPEDRLIALEHKFVDLQAKIISLNPLLTMQRGYSITTLDNRVISAKKLKVGDEIVTKFYDGSVKSKVLSIE